MRRTATSASAATLGTAAGVKPKSSLATSKRAERGLVRSQRRISKALKVGPYLVNVIANVLFLLAMIYAVLSCVFSVRRSDSSTGGLRRRLTNMRVPNRADDPTSLRHEPFPQRIRQEDREDVRHPLDAYLHYNGSKGEHVGKKRTLSMAVLPKQMLSVPKFWDPPALASFGGIRHYLGDYGSRLMTPEEAKSIGSVITKKRVDGTIEELETILVLFSSFRDWMCPHSVERIFERAVHPERIRVAIVDQITDEDLSCSEPLKPCDTAPEQALCKYADNIQALRMDASLSTGPIFARHLGNRMYRGEYFVMQSDAHIQPAAGWDVDVIDQWKSTGNEMAVLSAYVSTVTDNVDEETGERLRESRPVMCETAFEDEGEDRHLEYGEQPEVTPTVIGMPQLQPFWGAGFSFSRGHFIVNVPYDLHLPHVFMGEEISIGIRGFTYGYDYYTTERSILYHYYTRPPNPHSGRMAEKEIPKFWDAPNYDKTVELRAMVRLNDIIHLSPPGRENFAETYWSHVEEKKYGLGSVRTPELFYDTFGIHSKESKTEENLCMFVASNVMHNFFVKRLRQDSMGIDYELLNGFKFKNKWPKKEWWWYKGENPDDEGAEADLVVEEVWEDPV